MDYCVFLVEDEAVYRELVGETLREECVFESFSRAEDCLVRLAQRKPDLLLLDASLPGMDGYELCRRLKADVDSQDITVTFISAADTDDARMRAYEAGGEDFIAKPFDARELLSKVRVDMRIHAEQRQLKEFAGFAQKTAMTAMFSMSELGVVLEFLRKSFSCDSGEQLAALVLDAMEQYQLEGAVQIRQSGSNHVYSRQGRDVPLEVAVLNHVSTLGRIFEFRNRGVYNFGQLTLLVNNMPLDDPERCGRIRDNLAILAEGADARLRAMDLDRSERRKHQGLSQALADIREMLEVARACQKSLRTQSVNQIYTLLGELEQSFVSLGLSESQEAYLLDLVKRHSFKLIELNVQNDVGEAQLEQLEGSLDSLLAETRSDRER